MGCFSDLPEKRQFSVGPHFKLKRCPRYYLEKEEPEAAAWVNEMLRLWSAYEKGNMSSFCFSPSLKTIEAVDIIDSEIQRINNAAIEEANKQAKKSSAQVNMR